MKISIDNLEDQGIIKLLEEHLLDMRKYSPPESVHALDVKGLKLPEITFWSARKNDLAFGCIALKHLNPLEGEIKSMRTSINSRGKGIASDLLQHLIKEAKLRGYEKLYLETGSMDFFKPAHALYKKFGFKHCPSFGDYHADSNSFFMELKIN